MYNHILLPIDLAYKDKWHRAVAVAADLSRHYGATLTMVSVTGGLQAKVSHSTDKYKRLLAEFAQSIADEHDVEVACEVYDVPDPSVEVDAKLLDAIDDMDADLVVMASHKPGWVEYLVNSHGGRLASHARVSVFVVRDL
jgi:nucleotide-binding universal stress UspA family protein